MLKRIAIYILLSVFIISCSVCPKTNSGGDSNPNISWSPLFAPAIANIGQVSGLSHRSKEPTIINTETGEVVVPCIKPGREAANKEYYDRDKDRPVCKVAILNEEENREYLQILRLIEAFNKKHMPVRISFKGKPRNMTAKFLSQGTFDGSCGSVTDTGGDQHESEVDCFSSQAQQCAGWVANGWTWVKDYPPCYEFYH